MSASRVRHTVSAQSEIGAIVTVTVDRVDVDVDTVAKPPYWTARALDSDGVLVVAALACSTPGSGTIHIIRLPAPHINTLLLYR